MHHKSQPEKVPDQVACSRKFFVQRPANEFQSEPFPHGRNDGILINLSCDDDNDDDPHSFRMRRVGRSLLALASFIIHAESKTMRPLGVREKPRWRPSQVFVSEIFRDAFARLPSKTGKFLTPPSMTTNTTKSMSLCHSQSSRFDGDGQMDRRAKHYFA